MGEKSDGEVAQTLSQARQQADALGEKYGVQILLSSQCAGAAAQCDYDIALSDTMDSREELGSINAALKSIERCLALYPTGLQRSAFHPLVKRFDPSAGNMGGQSFLLSSLFVWEKTLPITSTVGRIHTRSDPAA